MDEFISALCRGRKSFRRSEAIAAGMDDKMLRTAVKHHALWHVCHGRYGPFDDWAGASALQRHLWRLEAAAEDAHCNVAASHVSALAVYGAPTWRFPLDQVHLVRVDGRSNRRTRGVVQHRGALAPEDVVDREGRLLTSPARTCLDVSTLGGMEEVLVVLDWFLHHGLVTKDELRARAEAFRQVPNSLRTDLAVELADARRESVGESRSAYFFWRYGVPPAVPQWPVLDEAGHEFARLDFAWPDHKVWLEFDGRQKWQDALDGGLDAIALMKRERRREQRIARRTGWRCIRITWADLERPEQLAAYIRGVLAGGPVH